MPEGQKTVDGNLAADKLKMPEDLTLGAKVEEVVSPEQAAEKAKATASEGQKTAETTEAVTAATPSALPTTAEAVDEVLEEVEEILEEDLAEVYQQLPADKKGEFKVAGEKTAGLISQMIHQTKLKTNKALILIVKWLKIIPGVNKFFLQQEAKIKTDKLVFLEEEEKSRQK